MSVEYRPVTRDDAKAVRALAVRAFGPMGVVFVGLEEGGHLAVSGNTVVGATVLKTFRAGGRKVGLVSWIMVDPTEQGQGIASRLMELAHEWFAEEAVEASLAMIEGYNQSSSKLFQTRGYRLLSFADQLREFRFGIFKVWIKSFFITAFGHFFWFRVADGDPSGSSEGFQSRSSALGVLAAVLIHAGLLGVIFLRQSISVNVSTLVAVVLGIPAAFVAIRATVLALAARAGGQRTVFVPWIGGLPLSVLIAVAAGGFLPAPGSVYPRARSYRYRDALTSLGPASFATGIVEALLLAAVHTAQTVLTVSAGMSLVLDVAAFVLLPIVILDVLPFFPFWGFAGRQVWNWSRAAWVVLALVAAGAVASVFVL